MGALPSWWTLATEHAGQTLSTQACTRTAPTHTSHDRPFSDRLERRALTVGGFVSRVAADDILAYLAAAHFLLHFVSLPVISAAAKTGRLSESLHPSPTPPSALLSDAQTSSAVPSSSDAALFLPCRVSRPPGAPGVAAARLPHAAHAERAREPPALPGRPREAGAGAGGPHAALRSGTHTREAPVRRFHERLLVPPMDG